MGRLDDKVILITGAARGQGATEARQAAGHGAHVVVTDVLDDLGQDVAAEIGGTYVRLDVTSSGEWRDVVEGVVAEHGRIDGLVNNAGIFRHDTLLEANEENFHLITEVNQYGVFYGMAAVAPTMRDQRSGSIVNISSIAGLRGQRSIAYVASKWAVRGMTKSAASTMGKHNVRVNSVHPGAIETDMLFDLGTETIDRLVDAVPMGRSAKPEEVGNVVMFLLSDESSYVSGAEIVVDGALIAG
ncbi:MAG: SDR family NAD(P)-dependent oxidoreductase [Acidimicrobiales bacterium]